VCRESGFRLVERESKGAEAPHQQQKRRGRSFSRGGNRDAGGRELHVLDGTGHDLVVTAATGRSPHGPAATVARYVLPDGNSCQALAAKMHTVHQPRAGEQIRKEQK
jgi:hypothetical protein